MIRNLWLLLAFGTLHANQPINLTPEQVTEEINNFVTNTICNQKSVFVGDIAQDNPYNPLTMTSFQLQEKLGNEQDRCQILRLLFEDDAMPTLLSILFFNNHDCDQILCSTYCEKDEYSISSAQFFTNKELLFNNQYVIAQTIDRLMEQCSYYDIFSDYRKNPILNRLALDFFKRLSDDFTGDENYAAAYIERLDEVSDAALLTLMTEVFEHHIPIPEILTVLTRHHPTIANHLMTTYWKWFEQPCNNEREFNHKFNNFYSFCKSDTTLVNKIIDIIEHQIAIIHPGYLLSVIIKNHPEFAQRLMNSYITMLDQQACNYHIEVFNSKLSALCDFFIEEKAGINRFYCLSDAKEFIQLNYRMHKTINLIERHIAIVDQAIVKSLMTRFSYLTIRLISAYLAIYEQDLNFNKYHFFTFCCLCLDKSIAKNLDASLIGRIAALIKLHGITMDQDVNVDLNAFTSPL